MDNKLVQARIVDFHDVAVSKMFGIAKPLNVTDTLLVRWIIFHPKRFVACLLAIFYTSLT